VAGVEAFVRSFLEAVEAAPGPDLPEVEATLLRQAAEAIAAYPSIAFDGPVLGRHLASCVGQERPLATALAGLRVTELWLACACVQGDERAMALFEHDFLAPAAAALRRAGESAADLDDALQGLRERLYLSDCKLKDFSGRGSLGGWTRVSLARETGALRRSRGRDVPLDENDAGHELPDLAAIDPDLAVVRRRYGETFHVAFRDAFGRLDVELRRLHATPSEVASLIAVVRSTLYGSIARLLRDG
jgi:RNA polymerase sigma-70 factor (ECF subfamily)